MTDLQTIKKKNMLFADKVRQLREQKQLLQRNFAAAMDIDTPLFSKLERGERRAKREQVIAIAKILQHDETELLTFWLADKIITAIGNEKELAEKALKVVGKEVKYDINKK